MAEQSPQIISLSLTTPEEMFVLAPADLFSEFRNFMTGLEYCISVLRSGRSRGPVQIDMALPAHRISEGMEQRVERTLERYCDHRIEYNRRERRAVRLDGLFSLWLGFPIVVLGFVLVIIKGSIVGNTGNANLILDSGGWVLVWVGLWFPLDTLLFSPLSYGRENRVLKRLRNADVLVRPRTTIKLTPGESPAVSDGSLPARGTADPSGASG
ncbi:MAG TPA: hypothetical protein VK773_12200 [Acidimicrobiales bacterium]|jgi:hypothetical protein|nr:hypothetical protein [Acidimicrobiales bacterium]